MDKLLNYLQLFSVNGVGEETILNLIKNFNEVSKIFNAELDELLKFVDYDTAIAIKESVKKDFKKKLFNLASLNVRVVDFNDPMYPDSLRNIPHPPPVIFVRGRLVSDMEGLAIVGTRKCTEYGRQVARLFAKELAQAGLVIIRGLARGIDTEAHIGALEAGGKTIGVLGSGIDRIYPPENRKLVGEIIKNGAVISEFPPGMPPLAQNFPKRNRIISGLARALLVVEAPIKSGVMSTVNWALAQGKDVFVVPGNITSKASEGTNQLIKDGAIPVTTPRDILDELKIYPEYEKKVKEIELSGDEKIVLDALDHTIPNQFDKISEKTHFSIDKLSSILLALELKGLVKQLPGRYFIKTIS